MENEPNGTKQGSGGIGSQGRAAQSSEGVRADDNGATQADSSPRWQSALGTIYILESEDKTLLKIGYTQRLRLRMAQLAALAEHSLGSTRLRVIGFFPGSRAVESELHRRFQDYRIHGDWYERAPVLRQMADVPVVLYDQKVERVLGRLVKERVRNEAQPPSAELNEAASAMGRKGGRRQVPKGFARMTPEERKRIQSLGGKARWETRRKKRK